MLILPIKSKWFNMILSGDKQEEYLQEYAKRKQEKKNRKEGKR